MNLSLPRLRLPVLPSRRELWRTWHDRQFWLRVVVVLLVLSSSALLAPRAPLLLLIAVAGAAGFILLLRWPGLGLVGLIAAAMIVPFEIGTGSESSLNAPLIMAPALVGIWLLTTLVRRRQVRILASRAVLAALALAASAVLAFGVGQLNWVALAQPAPLTAQIGGLALFIVSAAAFVLAAYQVKEMQTLQWMTWLFLALAALYITFRVAPPVARLIPIRLAEGATGSLFYVWLTVLAASQALFNSTLRWWARVGCGILAALTLAVGLILGRSWSSGWLPPLVALTVMIWVARPRIGTIIAIPVAIVGFYFYTDVSSVLLKGNEYSLLTRMEAWSILVELISVNPVTGLGPANYYWYTPLYAILGYFVQFNSHNNYIDIIAQSGLLGFGCFVWLVLELFILGWRLRATVAAGFARAYVYAALGGLAGMLAAGMLGDWIIPFVYNIGFTGFRSSVLGWIFLGGLVALDFMTQRKMRLSSD